MSELARWTEAVTEVTDLLRCYPDRVNNMWLRDFPKGSCSVVSYAVGRLLLERYGEQWVLVSRSGEPGTHTWLIRDEAMGTPAAIDATLAQFPCIASAPFVGRGQSPAEGHFPDFMGAPTYVALADASWHHGQTDEVYEWLFPQLGLRPFDRADSLRDLMPKTLAFPPVTLLLDAMLHAAESHLALNPYAIVLSPTHSSVLLRNSDAAMRRGLGRSDEYSGVSILDRAPIGDDLVLVVPVSETPSDGDMCFVGRISTEQFAGIPRVEFDSFDVDSLR